VAALDVVSVTETCADITAQGRRCHAIQCDLAEVSPTTAAQVIAECIEALGRIDILANNAGIIRRFPAVDFPEDDWTRVLHINLSSAFFLSQALARHLLGEGKPGKIVNTASVLSFEGGVFAPSYTASKSGLAGITRALANEWAQHGINVNAIAPSYFTTELTSAVRNDEERSRQLLERLPAGRYGTPDDVKGAVVFLASSAADYVHGAVVPVDGGWLAR
jgi:2-dehydro-3-deoxy-D-gluconate 5-dehydrogenase